MIERYEELVRENKRLKAQLETFRQGHYQTQAALASSQSRESSMVVLERDEYGKPAVWCDPEIADLVSALNEAGIRTVASCSGHGHRPGNIMLADGRELVIARDFDEARKIDAMFPGINGDPPAVQGEPVGRVKTVGGYPDESEHTVEWLCKYKDLKDGDYLYTAPQPAEQQPAPDASGLVEALEYAIETLDDCDMNLFHNVIEVGSAALAAHRKGGSDNE